MCVCVYIYIYIYIYIYKKEKKKKKKKKKKKYGLQLKSSIIYELIHSVISWGIFITLYENISLLHKNN